MAAAETVSVGCRYPNGLYLDMGKTRVEINGANAANVIGGHGITENVDKPFMEAWLAKHADLDIVKGGHLFINGKVASVIAEANEKANHLTGLEPLDPNKKPKNIEAIETPRG